MSGQQKTPGTYTGPPGCVSCLTCISVHKKQRCGLSCSESAVDRLPSLGLASDCSGSLLRPLHSELREKEESWSAVKRSVGPTAPVFTHW